MIMKVYSILPEFQNWGLIIRCSLMSYPRHPLFSGGLTSLQGIQSARSMPQQQGSIAYTIIIIIYLSVYGERDRETERDMSLFHV